MRGPSAQTVTAPQQGLDLGPQLGVGTARGVQVYGTICRGLLYRNQENLFDRHHVALHKRAAPL